MSEKNEDVKTEPQIVAIRDGKKGPGKTVVTVVSKEDAEKVKAELESEGLNDNESVIIRPMPQTHVETFSSWSASRVEEKKQAGVALAAREKLSNILSREELETLGIKV